VGVSVSVGEAVDVCVGVSDGVGVFVRVRVNEGVVEGTLMAFKVVIKRATRNCSTTPRCAETRCIIGQIWLRKGVTNG
jgi:hypothetical protein